MSKFQKRGYERKGEKKYDTLDAKLLHENLGAIVGKGGEDTD